MNFSIITCRSSSSSNHNDSRKFLSHIGCDLLNIIVHFLDLFIICIHLPLCNELWTIFNSVIQCFTIQTCRSRVLEIHGIMSRLTTFIENKLTPTLIISSSSMSMKFILWLIKLCIPPFIFLLSLHQISVSFVLCKKLVCLTILLIMDDRSTKLTKKILRNTYEFFK